MGKAGRGCSNGYYKIQVNEYQDHKRVGKWVESLLEEEDVLVDGKLPKIRDDEDPNLVCLRKLISGYVAVWKFIYSKNLGVCLNKALSTHFTGAGESGCIKSCEEVGSVLCCICEDEEYIKDKKVDIAPAIVIYYSSVLMSYLQHLILLSHPRLYCSF